jgi:hypothetical protein
MKPAVIHRQILDVYGENAMIILMVWRWVQLFNPLLVQFKALLHGQKCFVFFSVPLNLRTTPETGIPSREKNRNSFFSLFIINVCM